jgi:hypothetical protein
MITFQSILAEPGDELVLMLRNDAKAVTERPEEGILDVNAYGNWIRGLEILSGSAEFRLDIALKPFDPLTPSVVGSTPPGTVTYERDDGVEMAFLYLLYEETFWRLPVSERVRLLKVDHSIQNPYCRFGLDSEGGLVWVRIPMADLATAPEVFIKLLKK